jgi:hypothetical protein
VAGSLDYGQSRVMDHLEALAGAGVCWLAGGVEVHCSAARSVGVAAGGDIVGQGVHGGGVELAVGAPAQFGYGVGGSHL